MQPLLGDGHASLEMILGSTTRVGLDPNHLTMHADIDRAVPARVKLDRVSPSCVKLMRVWSQNGKTCSENLYVAPVGDPNALVYPNTCE